MFRLTTFAAVAALLFAAPSCSDAGASIAGTYVVDVDKTLDPMMSKMPGAEAMSDEQKAEAKKGMAKMFEKTEMTVNADGTYTTSAEMEMMGQTQKSSSKGTWKMEGDKVVFTQTHEDGKEKADTKEVTFKDGAFQLNESAMGQSVTVHFKKKA